MAAIGQQETNTMKQSTTTLDELARRLGLLAAKLEHLSAPSAPIDREALRAVSFGVSVAARDVLVLHLDAVGEAIEDSAVTL